MVQDALKKLNNAEGSTFSDIKTYIFTNYHVKRGFANWVEHILKQMVEKGEVKHDNNEYLLAKNSLGAKKTTLAVCGMRRRRRNRRSRRRRSKSKRRRRQRKRSGRSRSKSRRGSRRRRRRRRRTRSSRRRSRGRSASRARRRRVRHAGRRRRRSSRRGRRSGRRRYRKRRSTSRRRRRVFRRCGKKGNDEDFVPTRKASKIAVKKIKSCLK